MMKYVECKREQYVLRGMLHIPEGASAQHKVPMAIVLNGFTADRCDGYFINVEISKRLCSAGIASVRFDFMGSGESDGEFQDMSVLTEAADAEAMLRYVQKLDFVDTTRIAIQGLSQGGLVAFLTAGRHPDEIRCVSTWSPALVIHDCCVQQDIMGVSIQDIEEKGWVDFHGIRLGKQYYLDGLACDVYAEASNYYGPVQIVQGLDDQIVPYRYAQKMKDLLGENCSLYLYKGMSHFADSVEYNEYRYRHTLSFLGEHLLGKTENFPEK